MATPKNGAIVVAGVCLVLGAPVWAIVVVLVVALFL